MFRKYGKVAVGVHFAVYFTGLGGKESFFFSSLSPAATSSSLSSSLSAPVFFFLSALFLNFKTNPNETKTSNSVLRRRGAGRESRQAPPRLGAHGREEGRGGSLCCSDGDDDRSQQKRRRSRFFFTRCSSSRQPRRRRPQLVRASSLGPRLEPGPGVRREQGAVPRPSADHAGSYPGGGESVEGESGGEERCRFCRF